MPITEKQLAARKSHIGSSDMAAILGVDRFRNAYDVWAEKTDKITEKPRDDDDSIAAGNYFEDGVLKRAETALGPIRRNQYRVHPSLPLAANMDGLVTATGEPIEVKVAGLFSPIFEPWGNEGTNQVPDRVIIQSHVQQMCLAPNTVERGHVSAFLGGRGFLLYVVPVNVQLVEIIAEKSAHFWERNVMADIPPDVAPSIAIAKALKREPNKTVDVDPAIVQGWLAAKEMMSEAKRVGEIAERNLYAALGDAEAGVCGESGAVTCYLQKRGGYEVEPTEFRVLRHKKKGL